MKLGELGWITPPEIPVDVEYVWINYRKFKLADDRDTLIAVPETSEETAARERDEQLLQRN